jgi:hypothetical protein
MAGSLRHFQPLAFDWGGSTGYKLLLPLRVPSDTSFTTPRSEQHAHNTPAPAIGRHGQAP